MLRPDGPLLRAPHLRPRRRQVPLQRGRHPGGLPQEHRRLRTPRRHHPGQPRVDITKTTNMRRFLPGDLSSCGSGLG